MILDHKKRFKESPHHKIWHEASAADWFQTGLQVSMLEVQRSLPPAQDHGTAAANAFRLQGAQLLLSTLLNLTETTPTPSVRYDQNLNFQA